MRVHHFHQAARFSKRASAMSRRLSKLVSPEQPGGGSEYKRLAQRVLARLRERERLGRVLAVSDPCCLLP